MTSKGRSPACYKTLFGEVALERHTFQIAHADGFPSGTRSENRIKAFPPVHDGIRPQSPHGLAPAGHTGAGLEAFAEDGRAISQRHEAAILCGGGAGRPVKCRSHGLQLRLRHLEEVGFESFPCLLASRLNARVVSP